MEKLTKEQLEEIRKFDVPTVCNALETFNIMPRTAGFMLPGMQLRVNLQKPMIGYAATARVSANHPSPDAGEKLMGYYETVREMDDPTVAVIQDIDKQPIGSFWGEVQATVHKSLGGVGTLTDGGVRDLAEAEDLDFYFFSTEVLASHGYIHVESYGCTVDVCGLAVKPGDLVFADRHGAVLIPHEVADKLAAACKKVADAELPMLEPCRKAIREGRKPTMEEIRQWRKDMDEARKKV